MRASVLIAVSGAVILFTPALAQQPPSIDHAEARRFFDEASRIAATDAGRLWGSSLGGPMMLVDAKTRQVVASAPDSAGVLVLRDGVYAGVLPNELNAANTSLTWGGRVWTMLMWPVPDARYDRGRLFGHELFHRLQAVQKWPLRDASNAHLATREGRELLRLEMRALSEALIRNGEARKQAVEDALAFRTSRHTRFAGAADEERLLELNEGTAEYTGLRMSGLPASVLFDRAAIALAEQERSQNFARSFAYATGPAYGLLLDERGVAWRTISPAQLDFGGLLARAYRLTEARLAASPARAARYDGGLVAAQETARENRRVAHLDSLRMRFVTGPVIRVPPDRSFSMSFDPGVAEPLDSLGIVYPWARITDLWGVLSVENGGALFLSSKPGFYTGVAVPAPDSIAVQLAAGRSIKGAGWTLELTDGWKLSPDTRAGDWIVTRSQ